MHFFLGGCDWFIAETDGKDLMWGFVILNNDLKNAEWGFVSFSELCDIKVQGYAEVDFDLHWKKRKAVEVKQIIQCLKP